MRALATLLCLAYLVLSTLAVNTQNYDFLDRAAQAKGMQVEPGKFYILIETDKEDPIPHYRFIVGIVSDKGGVLDFHAKSAQLGTDHHPARLLLTSVVSVPCRGWVMEDWELGLKDQSLEMIGEAKPESYDTVTLQAYVDDIVHNKGGDTYNIVTFNYLTLVNELVKLAKIANDPV